MSTLLGVILNIIGWFFVPDVVAIRPYVIAVGVLALFIASFNAWLTKHRALEQKQKELDQLLASRPVIMTADAPEFDTSLSLYRLFITNTGNTTNSIMAKVERVILGSGEPHQDSARLPIRLQWMHHPDSDSIELGSEKVDLAFVQIVEIPPVRSGQRVWVKDESGHRRSGFPILHAPEPELYINIAGVTFSDFKIPLNKGESVYCEVAFYGSENKPAKTIWCRFSRDSTEPERHTAELISCYPLKPRSLP